jgi:hypothetical protein
MIFLDAVREQPASWCSHHPARKSAIGNGPLSASGEWCVSFVMVVILLSVCGALVKFVRPAPPAAAAALFSVVSMGSIREIQAEISAQARQFQSWRLPDMNSQMGINFMSELSELI